MTVNIYISSSIKDPFRLHSGVVGYVLQAGDSDVTKTVFGIVKEVTKNHADIICLKNALSHILSNCDMIIIHTNSNYVKQKLLIIAKNEPLSNPKFIEEWQVIYEFLKDKKFEVRLNEPNGFRSWLQSECTRRAAVHGFR